MHVCHHPRGPERPYGRTCQQGVPDAPATAAFTQLGKVYENFMVDVQATNEKLRGRARRIVCETTGVSEEDAGEFLRAADGSVKLAIVMAKVEVPVEKARALLDAADGNTRQALLSGSSRSSTQ